MAVEENGNKSGESVQPAAENRGREADSKAQSETEKILQRGQATLTLLSAWSENFSSLVLLEFQRTLGASKRILLLLMFLLFLVIAVLLSLCGALGLTAYYFSQSIYIGFGAFLLAQCLIVMGILLHLRQLRSLLGFDESRKQVHEAMRDVSQIFK